MKVCEDRRHLCCQGGEAAGSLVPGAALLRGVALPGLVPGNTVLWLVNTVNNVLWLVPGARPRQRPLLGRGGAGALHALQVHHLQELVTREQIQLHKQNYKCEEIKISDVQSIVPSLS